MTLWRPLLGLAAFGALWELLPRIGAVPARWAPPLSRVVQELLVEVRQPRFWDAIRDTLLTWAIGLGIAVAAGIVVGVTIGAIPLLRTVTASTIEFLRPIPSVALIPLVVLLYGTTIRSALVLVVYASFWQVLIQVLHGVADVDPVARDTADVYRLPKVRYLYWPTALPYVATGVRLATSVALILAVTGEMVIGAPGLGKQIWLAQQSDAVPLMYALVLVTGLIGVAANVLARFAERRALAWHPSVRREVPA
ncbi:MAG TPA: ABC transporter permease [Candidatus Limnocylindrales bacterium]